MSNIYRISPFLWNDATPSQNCQMAQTIYGVDRAPAALATVCAARPKEDPASYWEGRTLARLVLPATAGYNVPVTWSTLPQWLSYAQTQGYTIVGDIGKLKPYSDFYIQGP
jgi:hypothetical protein